MTKPDTQQTTQLQLEQQLHSLLHNSEHQLSAETQRRLAGARQAALAGEVKPHAIFGWPKLGAAVATIAVVAMLITPMFEGDSQDELLDKQVLAMDDELYQDLEFYQWLVETDAIDGFSG